MPDFYAKGTPLIIDPTIRQYFVGRVSPSAIEAVPKIFVGSPSELCALFDGDARPSTRARWLEKYLDAGRYDV